MPRSFLTRISLGLLLCALTLSAYGQKYNATLSGSVLDPSGALVPGATVTLTNIGTDATRTGTTDDQGRFVFAELSPATYKVSVKKDGFKEHLKTDVELHVGDARDLRIELAMGQVSEVVETRSDAVVVETQTGTVGNTILGQQVRELPLNGHNFIQLTTLMPGVATGQGFNPKGKGLDSSVQLAVSGGGANNNLFLVDGANNNDVGSNNTILIYPSIETIGEFKILRSTYGPEYGQASGGQVNLITRSGTNQFHGSAYYFGRNDALAAWDYVAKSNLSGITCPNPDPVTNAACNKQKLRRHDFGYSIGGPILKNRAFFFWSQEWNRETRSNIREGFDAPTALEKTGDFSQSCPTEIPNDPLTGLPFPGNVIPANRISPAGALFMQQYADANFDLIDPCASRNFIASLPASSPWREENVRGDLKINDKNNLMIRYVQDIWDSPFPNNFGWGTDPWPAVESSWSQPSKSAVAKLTTVISSTMVNDFQFSWSANRIFLTPSGLDPGLQVQTLAAIPSSFAGKDNSTMPLPTFWGAEGAPTIWSTAPWENRQDLFVWRDDFSKVFKSHTIKAGILYSRNAKDEQQQADEGGSINGPVGLLGGPPGGTGNGFASLLLRDMMFDYTESNPRGLADVRWRDIEFYVGDSWKASSRLTLEFGFRWSFLRQPYHESDTLSSFDPALFNPALIPVDDPCNGIVLPAGSNACAAAGAVGGANFSNRSLIDNNNHAIAPRFGFAWDITGAGKTVVRGGVGQFFNRDRLLGLEIIGQGGNPPFIQNRAVERTLDCPSPADPCTNLLTSGLGVPARGVDSSSNLANSWQWNLTVERELWRDAKLEVGYVGNRGIHLLSRFNVNQVLPGDRDGDGTDDRAQVANAASPYPNPLFPDASSLRPFGVLNGGPMFITGHTAGSIYHSLQSQFSTRFTRNSVFQASYTWSKLISDSSVGYVDRSFSTIDNTDPRLNRGPADYDRRHIFNASMVYYAPTLAGQNGFVRGVFGNWQFNTILSLSSGAAVKVTTGQNFPAGVDPNFGPSGTGNISLDGTAQVPNRVFSEPCHIDGADRAQWLNPNAYTLNGLVLGTQGTARQGDCTGPPTKNVDFSLAKNWKLPFLNKNSYFNEGLTLQFRLEFFNLFNHPQFGGPDTSFDVDTNVGGVVGNQIVGTVPAGFGRSSVAPYGSREIQYALKIIF